jgi:hypothetical protein
MVKMESKLNQLLKRWPKGAVATASWLHQNGVYRQLARQYVANGWMVPLGHGAFVRAGESADWLGGLYALQAQLGLGIHVAAATALSMKGLGHFLPLGGEAEVQLFGECRKMLPAWFARHPWGVRVLYNTSKLFESSDPTSFTTVEHGAFAVRVAAPERAMLEVFHLATTNAAIEHALELMAGLSTLRPLVVQSLLEKCRSVKAKRLFLWAAAEAHHSWTSRLDETTLDLGKGKRRIYRDGRLDAKYQITVPRKDNEYV